MTELLFWWYAQTRMTVGGQKPPGPVREGLLARELSTGCQAKNPGFGLSSAVGSLCNLRKVTSLSVLHFKIH